MCFLLYLGIYLFIGMLTLVFFSYFDKKRRLDDAGVCVLVFLLWPLFWAAYVALATRSLTVWLRDKKK